MRLFGEAGIARERLVFVPQSGSEEANLARYALVDLVLDPLPFGGVNGTIEALNLGVPVVTLRGRRHGERTSFSILQHLRITETIAASGSEYVALGVRLARDGAYRERLREQIRQRVQDSPLADPAYYVRSLERAYLEALRPG